MLDSLIYICLNIYVQRDGKVELETCKKQSNGSLLWDFRKRNKVHRGLQQTSPHALTVLPTGLQPCLKVE